jgi:hypothetical protein
MNVPAPASAAPTVCFVRRHRPAARERTLCGIDATALAPDVARALADAVPFLRCGEESAVHAFGRRLVRSGDAQEQRVLAAITADEERHAAWLAALAAALPPPTITLAPEALTPFFRRLLTRDKALHFARIAALDLAVCALLRPLVSPHGALASAPPVIDGLRAIRQDEARHVRVARGWARRLGWSTAAQHALDAAMRDELAALLAPVAGSLRRLGFVAKRAAPIAASRAAPSVVSRAAPLAVSRAAPPAADRAAPFAAAPHA